MDASVVIAHTELCQCLNQFSGYKGESFKFKMIIDDIPKTNLPKAHWEEFIARNLARRIDVEAASALYRLAGHKTMDLDPKQMLELNDKTLGCFASPDKIYNYVTGKEAGAPENESILGGICLSFFEDEHDHFYLFPIRGMGISLQICELYGEVSYEISIEGEVFDATTHIQTLDLHGAP